MWNCRSCCARHETLLTRMDADELCSGGIPLTGHEVIHFCDKHRHSKPRTTSKRASAHFYEIAGGAIDGSSTEARQFSFFAVGLVRAALAAHNKIEPLHTGTARQSWETPIQA